MKKNIGKQKIKNMISNAIILAAGKSTRFASFTYERPKGLFRVKRRISIIGTQNVDIY